MGGFDGVVFAQKLLQQLQNSLSTLIQEAGGERNTRLGPHAPSWRGRTQLCSRSCVPALSSTVPELISCAY